MASSELAPAADPKLTTSCTDPEKGCCDEVIKPSVAATNLASAPGEAGTESKGEKSEEVTTATTCKASGSADDAEMSSTSGSPEQQEKVAPLAAVI